MARPFRGRAFFIVFYLKEDAVTATIDRRADGEHDATIFLDDVVSHDLAVVMTRYFPGSGHAFHHGRAHYGQQVSGAALVSEFLKLCGAEVIFGIPGGASLPLNDALTAGHLEGAYRYVLTGHEQGAGFEAEGFAAACGRPGFCTATSGPGATNLITPLADATRDSRPLLALTGNTATTAEPEAFQALDIVAMTDRVATKRSYRPTHASQVQELLVHAFHAAVTGRPGAVLIDFPRNVQVQQTEMRPWEEYVALFDWSAPRASDAELLELAHLLASASRPLLYAGHGVVLSGAASLVRELSHRFSIPVTTTVHGLGILPADDPSNVGMLGMHGAMVANLAPYLSDVTVVLGGRFDDRVIGARPAEFAPFARLAHVDVDARQLNRVRAVDLAIHGDVCDAVQRLLAYLEVIPHADRAPWIAELASIKKALPSQSHDQPDGDALSHEWVYTATSQAVQQAGIADVIATFDVGTHQMMGAQWFPVSRPRSFITSGGMGSMGSALPMAVGAHFACPDALALAVCGDGGFVMSSHELDTIGAYGLPIKMLVFDDSALGMVSNQHSMYCEGRTLTSDRRRGRLAAPVDMERLREDLRRSLDMATCADDLAAVLTTGVARLAGDEWPFFAAQAAAYGIPAERVHTKDQFQAAVQRALAAPGPYLLQVMLPAPKPVYPLIGAGASPQEIIWRETHPGSGALVYAREQFDYAARRLHVVDI